MAESTNIAWTTSTFNPWIGCTKVSPGCDSCYAEAQDSRKRWGGTTHWGPGVARHRTSKSYWDKPTSWNLKQAAVLRAWEIGCDEFGGEDSLLGRGFIKPEPWRVFCGSLCDVFDNEVDPAWRLDLWRLIEATPHLDWLLVTKRIGNAAKMVPSRWIETWPGLNQWPDNVRLLITVTDQPEADRDIGRLLALPCKNGVSYEPALGPVDWMPYLAHAHDGGPGEQCSVCGVLTNGMHHPYARGIEWLIVGGESAQGGVCRTFDPEWAWSAVEQCRAARAPVFVKQMGSRVAPALVHGGRLHDLRDRAGADPAEWPEDLRVREFPG